MINCMHLLFFSLVAARRVFAVIVLVLMFLGFCQVKDKIKVATGYEIWAVGLGPKKIEIF